MSLLLHRRRGTPASNAGTPTPPDPHGPGEHEGFTLIMSEHFDTDAPEGSFFGTYSNMGYYPTPWPDTSGNGTYTPNIISAQDGIATIRMRTEGGTTWVAALNPLLPEATGAQDHSWAVGQTYGRYEVRFRALAPAPNYKIAWLLWPDSDDWNEGEINFPECDFTNANSTIWAFNHQINNPSENQLAHNSGASPYEWQTCAVEWTPERLSYWLNGELIASTTSSIPDTPMHWVLQCETTLDGVSPSPSTVATIEIDYVAQWRYDGEPVDPPEENELLGVGSTSTSLLLYPKIQNTTIGNWYVDASRPISGDGTTLATAFKTLQEGLNALQSGQTLLVKGGTYTPGRIVRNTAWSSRTRIMGYGTDRPVLDFDGVDLTWPNRHGIVIGSSSRNELWHRFYLTNCRNASNTGSALVVQAPTTIISDMWASHMDYRSFEISGVSSGKVTIQDCVGWRMGDGSTSSTDTGEHFLIVGSGNDSSPEDIALVRCVSINGGDDGFDLWSARSALILDCSSIGAGYYWNGVEASELEGDGTGFKMGGDSGNGRNNRIRGSIAVRSRSFGITANIGASSQYGQYHYINNTSAYNGFQGFFLGNHAHAENNIIYQNQSTYNSPGASTTFDSNSWDLSISNPQFANPDIGDYSLAAGSPAIGAGTNGNNLGASTVALELTRIWSERDTTGYAQPEWDASSPDEPGTGSLLMGVGSYSDSLILYPKVQNTTVGDWYVDGSRSSSGDGTSLSTAFRTIQEGLAALQSGQTLLVRGGTYNLTSRLNRTTSWASTTRIMGYGNDRPVITAVGFTNDNDSPLRFQSSSQNELWHRFYIRDVMSGSWQSGIMSSGNNITLSDIWVSHVQSTGIYITQAVETNIVMDCAVWHVGDASLGPSTNSGDCYGSTAWESGRHSNARFIRCFGANGPDDVYDLWGGIDNEIIDCVSLDAGYFYDSTPGSTSGGDGAGFKMGGAGGSGGYRNTIRGSIAVGSRTQGVQHNAPSGVTGQHTIINNTVVNSGGTGVDYGASSTTQNNLSISNNSTHSAGSGGTISNNSWQLGISSPIFGEPTAYDFSLMPGSPALGSGTGGQNLGASTIALEILKKWAGRDLTGYADPSWDDEDSGVTLLGVGSASSSLIDYPPTGPVTTGDMYVAPDGSDSNPGTFNSPKATLAGAISAASSGDTILVRDGTYTIGTSLRPKSNQRIFAYGNERPRLHRSSTQGGGQHDRYVFYVTNSGVHIKGFEITGGINNNDAPHSSHVARFTGSANSIWEDMVVHSGQTGSVAISASDNFLALDSVTIGCNGAGSGTNVPDGFMVTGTPLSDNVRFVRILTANTGDDATDFYYATNSRIIDSVAIATNYSSADGSTTGGDGNGFKMGGYAGSGPNHVQGSIVVHCRAQGLNHNSTPTAGNTFVSNTSTRNAYGILNDTPVGVLPGNTTRNIVVDNTIYDHSTAGPTSYNTWNLSITDPQFAAPEEGDFSLLPGSGAIEAGPSGENLGASEVALKLLKKWWNHSQIWIPGRGHGSGGTGLPGDTD